DPLALAREPTRRACRRKARASSEIRRTRREMNKELRPPGERPDPSLAITRRIFLHKSLLAGGAAGTATYGWFPLINTLDVAFGAEAFKFAWLSDNHLYPKNVNTRFLEKATRAVKEIQAMSPPADFLLHGVGLAELSE